VDFRPGLGLFWHGGLVAEGGVGIDFGLGFNSFVFVGADHFWGGDYGRFAFDRDRGRAFFDHSSFHAGYRMEGGHLRAEGLGRDHMAAITHHAVEEHKASEMRKTEEHHNFAKRAEEHPAVTHLSPAEHGGLGGGPTASHTTPGGSSTPGRPTFGGTPGRGTTGAGRGSTPSSGGKPPSSEKKPD
jgi:hypothetical protein